MSSIKPYIDLFECNTIDEIKKQYSTFINQIINDVCNDDLPPKLTSEIDYVEHCKKLLDTTNQPNSLRRSYQTYHLIQQNSPTTAIEIHDSKLLIIWIMLLSLNEIHGFNSLSITEHSSFRADMIWRMTDYLHYRTLSRLTSFLQIYTDHGEKHALESMNSTLQLLKNNSTYHIAEIAKYSIFTSLKLLNVDASFSSIKLTDEHLSVFYEYASKNSIQNALIYIIGKFNLELAI